MYSGDPSHGKFYYRCVNRCRQLPIIQEDILNSTVWDAVSEAIRNPELITKQIDALRNQKAQQQKQERNQMESIEKSLRQVQTEEGRLLEAYRLSILNPQQLQDELVKVNNRKSVLQSDKAKLLSAQDQSNMPKIKKSIENYCNTIKQKLIGFDLEAKQKLLRLLLNGIVFEGKQVRIRGIIPASLDKTSDHGRGDIAVQDGIADTMTEYCVRPRPQSLVPV
jgi:hypothetical protein